VRFVCRFVLRPLLQPVSLSALKKTLIIRLVIKSLVVLVLCAGERVSAQEAILNYGTEFAVGYADGGAGFEFTPLANISVTSLGYSQSGLASYSSESDTAQVSLWSSTGSLLSTALIANTDSTFNQSYYQAVSPLTLYAGVSYFIGAAEPASGTWTGDLSLGTFSVSPNITYLGVAEGTNIWAGLVPNTTTYLTEGPDFQYTVNAVPEPSTLSLIGLGLAALARRRLTSSN
jgi:hypothetical protein